MTTDEKRKFQDEKAAAVLKAYQDGFRHALQTFAWWHDGTEVVGSGMMTLSEAIHKMETLYNYNPPRI